MALEDELKARTLALVSQQMAGWVVEIQKRIVEHQANLVGALDELQENVARYDEKIDESAIEGAIGEVFAQNPVAAPAAAPAVEAGPSIAVLLSAMAEVDTGANLTEVLTSLVNESAKQTDRVAMFIVKGANAVGWYAKGFDTNEAVKQIQIPLKRSKNRNMRLLKVFQMKTSLFTCRRTIDFDLLCYTKVKHI